MVLRGFLILGFTTLCVIPDTYAQEQTPAQRFVHEYYATFGQKDKRKASARRKEAAQAYFIGEAARLTAVFRNAEGEQHSDALRDAVMNSLQSNLAAALEERSLAGPKIQTEFARMLDYLNANSEKVEAASDVANQEARNDLHKDLKRQKFDLILDRNPQGLALFGYAACSYALYEVGAGVAILLGIFKKSWSKGVRLGLGLGGAGFIALAAISGDSFSENFDECID